MSIFELSNSRHVAAIVKGDAFPVQVSPSLAQQGWRGGVGVAWSSGGDEDTFEVALSDGSFGGFLLWGSDEPADQFLAQSGSQIAYRYATLCTGNWFIWTDTFEQYTYLSRQGGPLVPLTYNPGDLLYFSLRGYWTVEDEWVESSDPRAPNPRNPGTVVLPPSDGAPLLLETTL